MWYVLQTLTGKEEELTRMINKIIPHELYSDCFVAYYERIWRRQGQSIVHIERLFPGYVFIVSPRPEELFHALKRVPAMSKLISDGFFTFLALEKEEEAFLQDMLGDKRIVSLSYVKTDGRGNVSIVSEPLKHYMPQVVRFQLKKRYVILKLRILGVDKTIALGIILNEDIRQEITYGKVEIPLKMPTVYSVYEPEEGELLAVGDHIKVTSGALEHMKGVIWKIKKHTVEVGVRLFDQDMAVEIPKENICKTTSYKEDYGKDSDDEKGR